jgi:hypothetical protein
MRNHNLVRRIEALEKAARRDPHRGVSLQSSRDAIKAGTATTWDFRRVYPEVESMLEAALIRFVALRRHMLEQGKDPDNDRYEALLFAANIVDTPLEAPLAGPSREELDVMAHHPPDPNRNPYWYRDKLWDWQRANLILIHLEKHEQRLRQAPISIEGVELPEVIPDDYADLEGF